MSGWKDWAIGEVVTESEFQSFVQDQVVQVYDDATDRDNTLGANVAEGMVCYLKDVDETQVYDGTDWVQVGQGTITEVVAGTALTGGGSSGSVTLNVDESEIEIDPDQVNGTAVVDNDSRLTDARTPTSHATTHESGGTDELSLDGSQVSDATPTSVGVVKGSTPNSNKVALGDGALASLTSGGNLVAVGQNALGDNTSGSFNTAIGQASLQENTTGNANTAVGQVALQLNTTGIANTALGRQALSSNTTGDSNTAVGRLALSSNIDGNENTALALGALRDNTTGSNNTAVGRSAMLLNTTGNDNTALGRSALSSNTTGNFNTAVGRDANTTTTTGSNVGTFGQNAQPSSSTVNNEITLGNSNITSLRCNATLSSLSDQRDKTNIQDSPLGLDLIERLRPVTFDWDRRDGSFAGMKDVGFIAQDVVEVEDELDIEDTLRMSYRSNPEKLEVAPARLIPVLTKAIQELSEQNAELKARLDKLEGK